MVDNRTSFSMSTNKQTKKFPNENVMPQAYTRPLCLNTSSIEAPIFAGDSHTVTPASFSALILSWAVPFPPDTIAALPERSELNNYSRHDSR